MSSPDTTSDLRGGAFDGASDSMRATLAHSLERETLPYLGIAIPVGAIGAATVAAFVFAIDWIAGHPLATPNVLGSRLLLGEPLTFESPTSLGVIFGYSLVHAAAFVVAAATALVLQTALRKRGLSAAMQAVVVAGAMFVGLEALFAAMMALVGGIEQVDFGVLRIAGGNALASLVMAGLLYWRTREIDALRDDALS